IYRSICSHYPEDDGYVVQIRLRNAATPQPGNAVWGEEIADSIEAASEMIADPAAKFCIPQDRITFEIRMKDMVKNTRHWRRVRPELQRRRQRPSPHQIGFD